MGHSLVTPRHRWDNLSTNGQKFGVDSEVTSEMAPPYPGESRDSEPIAPPHVINVTKDVYMTKS